jgi:hypothetical protein
MAQTAVNWLIKIYLQTNKIDNFDIEVAKEMEKEQIIDFAAQVSYGIGVSKDEMKKVAEQYYNETYNK